MFACSPLINGRNQNFDNSVSIPEDNHTVRSFDRSIEINLHPIFFFFDQSQSSKESFATLNRGFEPLHNELRTLESHYIKVGLKDYDSLCFKFRTSSCSIR